MRGFIYITLLLGLCYTCPTIAQSTGIITGIIADSTTQESLLGVNVKAGETLGTSDYIDGKYELELVAGVYDIEFSYLGYASLVKTVTITSGKTVVMNISMMEEATLLEQATVTSSKFKKPLGEVTVSLAIISPDLLENTNSSSVNQALDKVPGVNTMGDQVTIRGGAGFSQGTGSRVLILMDDMPAMQADAGLPNWRDLPTENIQQMEVLKGSASALYGSSAMNGVINIRTALPTNKPYTKVSIFGTMYGDPKDTKNKWWTGETMPFELGLQLAHRRKIGKFDVVLGSNLFYNQSYMLGYKATVNNPFDGGYDPDEKSQGYDHKARVTANIRYRHTENLIFSLNTNVNMGSQNAFMFHSRINPNPALGLKDLGLYETDFAPAPKGYNFRMTIDPAVTYYDKFTNRHRAQFRYFYINNVNEGNQSNQSNSFYGEYQYLRKFEKLDGLEVVAGFVGTTIVSTSEVYSNDTYQHTNFAAYLQLDKQLFKRLNISLGFRYEINLGYYPDVIEYDIEILGTVLATKYDTLENPIEHRPVFRAGASYKISQATFIRASWGQGYRFPTILEKFIATSAGGISIIPNPTGLVSETGWSLELGIKQGFKIGKWQGFIDVAGFWTEYDNMMEFQAAPDPPGGSWLIQAPFQIQNIGNTRITGIDASIIGEGNIGPVKIQLMAGYTLLIPTYRDFDDRDSAGKAEITAYSTSNENVLKYRNQHTVKFDAQGTFKGFSLGATFQYLSFMKAIDIFLDGENTVFQPYTKTHYFREKHNTGSYIFNVRASYQFKKFLKLSFLVNNIINDEYALQPGKLEGPRNFSLRVDFTF
jgi:outer membrane receptor protein involved in Fe transport